MKSLYNAPEAEILEIKIEADVCDLSQGPVTNGPADPEHGDLV